MRGARGWGDYESGGRVGKAMHSGCLSYAIMGARWKHPFTCIVAGPTGCGKSTFVSRMLRHAAAMIDPPTQNDQVVLWRMARGLRNDGRS